jgi:drug/metabolite transporter (DMT)-like permease
MSLLGPAAALASSCTWAFASARFTTLSRAVGGARVNLSRALVVAPFYLAMAFATSGARAFAHLPWTRVALLTASVVCSYGFADGLFFLAARRIGISTALAIASTYPLWAALFGAVVGGERFGPLRALGTVACVAGVAALVLLSRSADAERATDPSARTTPRRDAAGLLLAGLISLAWAGNAVAIQRGSVGLSVFQANALRYGFAFVVLLPSVTLAERARRGSTAAAPAARSQFWLSFLPAVFADGVIGSTCFVWGLAHSDLAVGATLTSLAPLISVPVAIALGEERWNAPRAAAVAVTVAGVAMLVSTA